MTKKTELIFIIAMLMHLLSYPLPFLQEDFGLKFFMTGIEALIDGDIGYDKFHVFFAFFSPIITLPFLIVGAWKGVSPKYPKTSYGLFFFFLVFPILLSIYVVLVRGGISNYGYLGYSLWVLSLLILFWGYIQRTKKHSDDYYFEEDDISQHLVEDEN